MDASIFIKDERPREYWARFRIEGEVQVMILAESLDEAIEKAGAMLAEDGFGRQIDEVACSEVEHVWKGQPMYLVTRNGREMSVSRLQEGDIPREPNEYELRRGVSR